MKCDGLSAKYEVFVTCENGFGQTVPCVLFGARGIGIIQSTHKSRHIKLHQKISKSHLNWCILKLLLFLQKIFRRKHTFRQIRRTYLIAQLCKTLLLVHDLINDDQNLKIPRFCKSNVHNTRSLTHGTMRRAMQWPR